MHSLVVAWGARHRRWALGTVILLALARCGGTPSGTADGPRDAAKDADAIRKSGDSALHDGAVGDAIAGDAPSCAPPDAGAPVRLFYDDFSETPAGEPPSAALWTVTATAPVTATVGRGETGAPFVALSSPSTCTSGCVAQISPKLTAPPSGSSLWTRATVTLGASPTDYAYVVQLLGATGTLYVELLIEVHAAALRCSRRARHSRRDAGARARRLQPGHRGHVDMDVWRRDRRRHDRRGGLQRVP